MSNVIKNATREVANLGRRPYSTSIEDVGRLIARASGELALLSLKPGFYPNHPDDGKPLQAYIEGMVSAAGLGILCTAERVLSPLDACELYRNVTYPNPEEDVEWGVAWKREITDYMTSGPVFSYLLEGQDAFRKAHVVKAFVRNYYAPEPGAQIVKNIVHVPDPHDFDISVPILLMDGLSYKSLEDSKMY